MLSVRAFIALLILSSTLSVSAAKAAEDLPGAREPRKTMFDALTDGKFHAHLRLRFESVDDDLVPARNAEASTLRAVLGWETGVWSGFSAYAEMEHVSQVGVDNYKEGPGPVDPSNVNRIFGNDAPDPFDTFNCNCHFINARYRIFTHLNLEAYGYLLDIDNAVVNSTNTGGIRASIRLPVSRTWSILSTGEFATQSEAAQNPRNINADYYLGEIGLGFAFRNELIKSLTLKLSYEVLVGDGAGSFITPLATGHAFQGWADRFLTTPLDGIEDMYMTAVADILGGRFILSYHMIESDNMDYDYGNELDILYSYRLGKRWSIGAKAAIYDADVTAISA